MKKRHEMRVRMAVIGCGRIAQRFHIRNIVTSDRIELVALCDHKQELAQALAGRYHVPRTYNDYSELLKQDDIDAVVITTPTATHYELVSAALEAEKHVFVEKPMSMTVGECERIVKQCEKSGSRVMVGFQRRFDSSLAWCKRKVEGGALGKLLTVNSNLGIVSSYSAYLGATDKYIVGDFKQSPGHGKDFHRFMLDTLIHHADLLCWFGGAAKSVLASGNIGKNFVVNATIRFERGHMGHIQFVGLLSTDWREEMTLHGDRGSIFLRMAFPYLDQATEANFVSREAGVVESPFGVANTMYQFELENFVDCVLGHNDPVPGALEALEAQRLIEGINESFRRKSWVNV